MQDHTGEQRFFPLALDLNGRSCLVIGGGRIGTRKAVTLAHAGGRVTVVAPEGTKALREAVAAGQVDWIEEPFAERHLDGVFLVVVATDDADVNAAAAEAAAGSGALVCDASSAERSQVIFGATLRREDTTVAVYTDGRDPSRARQTRDRIATLVDADRAKHCRDDGSCCKEEDRDTTAPRVLKGDPVPEEPAALVMIGACLEGGLPLGHGPAIRYSEPERFSRAKKSHKALRAFLDWVRENTKFYEAFVWNTCQRIEFYGWLPAATDAAARERMATRIRHGLYADGAGELEVNVLSEAEARHHLFRTVCGLNSEVPGDRDVAAQLQTAFRLAQCAGTAGPRAAALVEEAQALAEVVTSNTEWSRFSTGYCKAAMARVFEEEDVRPDELRFVVIGGSTTSRSVLSTLTQQHGVPERQLTVVYRDHHGQMKQMRAAVGSGKRLRVHAYSDERVQRAIANADYVVFGLDQPEPVIDASALLPRGEQAAGPLTVVDFNTFGSIANAEALATLSVWTASRLDHAVAAHVAITTSRADFARAVEAAETRIERHLGPTARGRTARSESRIAGAS